MKKSILKFFLSLVALSAFLFSGCEVGLGESLDLEAPELTITSPSNFSYQPLHFTITGTCKDNKGVTSVVVLNKETGEEFGYATIENDTWHFDVNFTKEDEGEITFRIEANDKAGNTSAHSARNLTLLVDEHAPEAKSWYVDRGNSIQASLETKEFLESLDFTLSENKNYPQNQHFTLYGNFYDAMGIDTITVKLYEDTFSTTVPVASKTVNVSSTSENYIGDGKSIYSPSFYFDESDFVNGNPLCISGKHYMRVVYYAKDNDDPVNFNDIEVDTKQYILWYPESDYPGIQQIQIEDGKIRVSVGSSIPVDFFDDDGLKEIHCALKNDITGTLSDYTQAIITDAAERTSAFTVDTTLHEVAFSKTNFPTTSFQTDYPTQIDAPNIPAQMYLIGAVLDVNDKWNARVIPVEVVDAEKPMLFISSPSENEYPIMESDGENFKFTGYSLDTKGSKYIKIAYIPTESEERAKQLLTQYKNDTTAKKEISGTGEVIWYKAITGGELSSDGWLKQSFDISMNLFEDFKDADGNSTAKLEKFFEILLVDTDGNEVYKPFTIQGDSTKPLIDIQEPETELKVHDYTVADLKIKFKGYKNSGIAIDSSKYKITTKIGDTTYSYVVGSGSPALTVDTSGYANLTIPKETLTNWVKTEGRPTFTFYATDILGNGGVGEDMRSVILSPRPVIQSITIDKNDGTYKAGTIMKFKVTFSREVKVTNGTPKLIIKYSESDTTPKYATYNGDGSGTNALNFSWTVPENAYSNKIICTGFSTSSEDVLSDNAKICATELGEGDIYTSITNSEVLKGKTIKVDGIAPKIDNITVTSADGNNFCTKDKVIRATVKFTKPVQIEGSPTLILKVNNTNISFTFENWNEDEIVFKHPVTDSDPQGIISWAASYAFSNTGLIKDSPGNSVSLAGGKNGTSTIEIDCTKPSNAPTISPSAGSYNVSKTITLNNIEENATAYFSKDGGLSWINYSTATTGDKTLGNGSYELMSYQEDRAGNKSDESAKTSVTINNLFPEVVNFGIDLPNGDYGKGEKVTFTIDFSSQINVTSPTDLVLTFASNEDASISKTCNVTVPTGNKASRLSFTYTVVADDNFKGIVVKEIAFANTVTDLLGNVPAFAEITPSNCSVLASVAGGNRTGINLDGIAPELAASSPCTPADGGVASMTDNSSESFKITLKFNENVYAEKGTIILQRKGDWYIPAVFKVDEFNKYYNQMTDTYKEKMLRLGTDGYELMHSQTGIPVGPYRKITQGLKVENGKYVPDTETKFVLAYELGLDSAASDGEADLDDGTLTDGTPGTFTAKVTDIREALESVDYHRHKVDVASSYVTVTGDTVEITFQEAIEDGREWELIIPPTAFRDNAENFYKGMNLGELKDDEKTEQNITSEQQTASDSYSLWSNNVAQPVVRVDRYTHGWGAHEPNADGSAFTDITVNNGKYKSTRTANSAAAVAPTGYCRVRIDCETPGAAIKYSKLFNNGTVYDGSTELPVPEGAAYNGGSVDDNTDYHTNKRNTVEDITKDNLEIRGVTPYSSSLNGIVVGDGNYTAARKDYITAYATKTINEVDLEPSKNGYEGIFKTIVYIKSNNTVAALNIEGGTAPGGQPSVNGFPLKDATSENDPNGAGRYSKNCYIIDGDTRKTFVFVSYEILSSNWAILLCGTNHSRDYPLNSYGEAAYITKQNFWSGTNVQ